MIPLFGGGGGGVPGLSSSSSASLSTGPISIGGLNVIPTRNAGGVSSIDLSDPKQAVIAGSLALLVGALALAAVRKKGG